jgi:mono/diheme cytochrome c family protein
MNRSRSLLHATSFGALLALGVFAACRGNETAKAPAPPPAPAISPAALAEATEIFTTRCGACHGKEGRGNGPAAVGFNPKPRNFTDAVWQASVTDEHIEKIIVYGGAAVGKNPAMPPNPDLMAKKETVAALRAHVRLLSSHL